MFDIIEDFMKVIKTGNLKKIKQAVETFPITQAHNSKKTHVAYAPVSALAHAGLAYEKTQSFEVMEYLESLGLRADYCSPFSTGNNALIAYIENKGTSDVVIEYFLSKGASFEIYDKGNGETPLHSWAMFNEAGFLELALKHGANPNIKSIKGEEKYSWDNIGATPLIRAAFANKKPVGAALKVLIKYGADINAAYCGLDYEHDYKKYKKPKTPLDKANISFKATNKKFLKNLGAKTWEELVKDYEIDTSLPYEEQVKMYEEKRKDVSFTPKGEITDIKEAFKNLDKKAKNLKVEILNILKTQYKLWKKDKKVNEKTLSFSADLLEILEYDTKNLKGACKKAWIKDLEEEADAIYDSMYSFKMERDNPEKFKKLEARIQKAISLEYAIMEKLKSLRANQNIATLTNKEILKNYKEIFEGALEKEIAEILFVVLQNDDEESALEIIKKACKEDLIDEDFDIYLPELRLNTPILIAVAFFNRAKIINYLLSQDYEIDRSDFGNTPLFLAAKMGHIESAKVLIKNGAELDYINCFDQKLLLETIATNLPQSTAMCELLIESGAKLDDKILEATKAKLKEAENEAQKKAVEKLIKTIESKL